jgi:hypothetical protein
MQTIDDAEGLQHLTRELIGSGDGPDLPEGERRSHLERLVEQAIEFLKIGHEKVQSAALAKCAAEAELNRYRDQVKGQVDIKIREIETQLEQSASQLAAAEQRAIAAEGRANKAEVSVRRLESEIRMRRGPRIVRTAA